MPPVTTPAVIDGGIRQVGRSAPTAVPYPPVASPPALQCVSARVPGSKSVAACADMTNVSKMLRTELEGHFAIGRPEIVTEQISVDGTRKWLLRFPPRGAGRPVEVETVYIPEEGRGTLCVSSQVGCTLTCSFCHT